MEPISEILKKLRIKAGLSQKEEADLLRKHGVAVNNAHISRWENGSNNPSIEQFVGICGAFGIQNVHEVFGAGELLGLEQGLNKDGVDRLLEYREILLRHPAYRTGTSSEAADESGGPHHGALDEAERKLAQERRLQNPKVRGRSLRSYTLGRGDPIAEDQFTWIEADSTVPEEASFAVVTSGDAMYPVIRHGSRLWFAEANQLEPGETGLIRLNGVLYVRTMDVVDGRTALLAYNEAFLPIFPGEKDDFEVLGRALALPKKSRAHEAAAEQDGSTTGAYL